MTRLMLVCGDLEAGRDGVGDYCRRLAAELSAFGHECLLVSFNDQHVEREVPEPARDSIRVVRLSAATPRKARAARVAALLADWKPDWVSLQFVAYAFQRRGLPCWELLRFPGLFRNQRLHVMLHELWVGLGHAASPRNFILGALQRWIVTVLLRRLRPAVLHTGNAYYKDVLARCGIEAEMLPLFGNIPVTSDPAGPWLAEAIVRGGGPDISHDGGRHWLFGLFGNIAPNWPADRLFERLSKLARASGRRAVVVSVGTAGTAAATLFERWRATYSDIAFVLLGPRSPTEVSQFMNTMDVGLTSYPLYLLGKSGSIAAMVEHGLPVIATWGDLTPELSAVDPRFAALIWRDDEELERRLRSDRTRQRHPDWCATVAKMLLSRLSSASSSCA